MRLAHLLILAVALALTATPANAGPLGAIIAGIVSTISASPLLTSIFKIVGSVVLSKLSERLRPKRRQPGISTEVTGTGALNPCSFPLGRYATAGVHVCPPMSHGTVGGIPNLNLQYVVELSDVPGAQLVSIIVDGTEVPIVPTAGASYGYEVTTGKYAGRLWVKYWDGTQTAADPLLLSLYGSRPDRPWQSDMIGQGICYAVVTFHYDRTIYPGFPQVRFVMQGVPLYDPRKDSTAGGSGAHRWANRATWEATDNPIVMVYNLHRGISVAGHVFGAGDQASALPTTWWVAAMNACDTLVDDGDGGTEAQFRAGLEVLVSDEPAAVAEELLRAALAQVADMGGRWLVTVADAGLPVYFLTDDDLISTQGGESNPFPPPQETANSITATYPEPAQQWESATPPMLTNATWEAQDGARRRTVSVQYPAVPYAAQVQRLMRATIAAERRFLTHSEVLPPEAMALDLLDAVSWTSSLYGYTSKLFQIGRLTEDLQTGIVTVFWRERDPSDLAIPPGYYTPPTAVSGAPGSVSQGPIAIWVIGPASPVVRTGLYVDSAVTGWITALNTAIFDADLPTSDQQFTAMLECTLTGASAPKPLVWRFRAFYSGGDVVASLRTDYLVPGQLHRLTAAGSFQTPDNILALRIEISGMGLASGEQIDVTLAHFRAYFRNR
jgi:hypothetical protein